MVKVLAFYSDDLSPNPDEVYSSVKWCEKNVNKLKNKKVDGTFEKYLLIVVILLKRNRCCSSVLSPVANVINKF